MLESITLQSACSADIPELLSFVQAAREQMFPKLHDTPMPADLAAFEQVYVTGPGYFLVARRAGTVVGVIGYLPYDRRFAGIEYVGLNAVEVVRLFVVPEYRRAGLARALYQALQAQARQSGVKVIYLHTHPFLAGAVEFWYRQGFGLIRVDPDRVWQTTHMQLRLIA